MDEKKDFWVEQAEKQAANEVSSGSYYAACNTGHAGGWTSGFYNSYSDASKAAREHDKNAHGGQDNAVVIEL